MTGEAWLAGVFLLLAQAAPERPPVADPDGVVERLYEELSALRAEAGGTPITRLEALERAKK